jgi:hypothetical protein
LTELRTALGQAYQAAGRTLPTYTDPTVAPGLAVIQASHLNELRNEFRAPVQGGRSPYRGTPFVVPGLIEAEDFDNGGEGVAYHDLTPGNQGGAYRTDVDVDIVSPYANGYAGSWWTFQWVGKSGVALTAGQHILRVYAEQQYFNLDAIRTVAETAP